MDLAELQQASQVLALRVVRVCEALPDEWRARALGRDLLRCGTSIGALSRASARAKTPTTIAARLDQVDEAIDDTLYWLELIALAGMMPPSRLKSLTAELAKLEEQVAEMVEARRPRRGPRAVKSPAAA